MAINSMADRVPVKTANLKFNRKVERTINIKQVRVAGACRITD